MGLESHSKHLQKIMGDNMVVGPGRRSKLQIVPPPKILTASLIDKALEQSTGLHKPSPRPRRQEINQLLFTSIHNKQNQKHPRCLRSKSNRKHQLRHYYQCLSRGNTHRNRRSLGEFDDRAVE